MKASDIFTPGSLPQYTYYDRLSAMGDMMTDYSRPWAQCCLWRRLLPVKKAIVECGDTSPRPRGSKCQGGVTAVQSEVAWSRVW